MSRLIGVFWDAHPPAHFLHPFATERLGDIDRAGCRCHDVEAILGDFGVEVPAVGLLVMFECFRSCSESVDVCDQVVNGIDHSCKFYGGSNKGK